MNGPSGVDRARDLLARAERIVVLTGAGVSAESGVPTFRGAAGLWRTYRPEELATPEAFRRDPALVWEWYQWRRELIAACAPNPAHIALARLALARRGVTLVTQNVDGLHHRAARRVAEETGRTSPQPAEPLEVHGAIHRDRCSSCTRRFPASDAPDGPPPCPECSAPLRPDVVWFGEALDGSVIGAAISAAEQADLCLVVGTSALVYPAAGIPEVTAERGGVVIEVNLEETALSDRVDLSLRGEAGVILPRLVAVDA